MSTDDDALSQARLSVHLHSNSVTARSFCDSVSCQRPALRAPCTAEPRCPTCRLDQRERFDAASCSGAIVDGCAARADVARQRDVRPKRLVLAQLESALPQPDSQAARRSPAAPAACAARSRQSRLERAPELDLRQDAASNVPSNVDFCADRRVQHALKRSCGDCAEKQRRVTCRLRAAIARPSAARALDCGCQLIARAASSAGHSAKNSRRCDPSRASAVSASSSSQRARDGLAPHGLAVAGEMFRAPRASRSRRRAPGPAEPHGADRLAGLRAVRPGDAGHGDRDLAAERLERADRHLARGRLAHRAVRGERRGAARRAAPA